MKNYILIIITIWVVLVGLFFSWNLINAKKEQERTAFKTARTFFEQVVITRAWNALHGGIYVPVTNNTKPNPYLDDPLRDIEVDQNLKLTKVNPAYMTRQIAQIAKERRNIKFHITSLSPIRPANSPDELEKKALLSFEEGKKEYGKYLNDTSKYSFFYMAPLKTKKSCLKCHAKQGYKEGDIRGGISVSLPFIPTIPIMTLILGHSGIGLFGIIGIVIFGKRLNNAYEEIKRQAVLDALTGIPNRLSFSQRIIKEFKRCQRDKMPLSIVMCDVDNFKVYNDTYGHKMGDECLKKISKSIMNCLKRPGDFCARYGGEEFVVVLPNTPKEGALHIAESIRKTVLNMNIINESSSATGVITLSLGVATAEYFSDITYEQLIICADKALYNAKEKGRNRVEIFDE